MYVAVKGGERAIEVGPPDCRWHFRQALNDRREQVSCNLKTIVVPEVVEAIRDLVPLEFVVISVEQCSLESLPAFGKPM